MEAMPGAKAWRCVVGMWGMKANGNEGGLGPGWVLEATVREAYRHKVSGHLGNRSTTRGQKGLPGGGDAQHRP